MAKLESEITYQDIVGLYDALVTARDAVSAASARASNLYGHYALENRSLVGIEHILHAWVTEMQNRGHNYGE